MTDPADNTAPNAVTVYRARHIVTLDPSYPTADAVAVRDQRVLHVGSFAEVQEALAGRGYDVTIDERYAGDVIVPGFIEAHGHMMSDGAIGSLLWVGYDDRNRADGSVARGCTSVEMVVDRLREAAAVAAPGETLMAVGFDPVFLDGRSLTRHDLDQASTTVPIRVMNASLHLAYANSVLMAAKGVTAATTDAGVIKDIDGEPLGEFHETAMALILDGANLLGGNAERSVRDGASLARRAGCTTVSDIALFAAGGDFDTYRATANADGFPVRVVYSPVINHMQHVFGAEGLLAHVQQLRSQNTARFAAGPLKWIADGSIQGYTGKLQWPGYCSGHDHGFLILDEDQVVEQLLPFHKAGFQAAVHTNGDEATNVVINAIERVIELAPRPDHRHRLEHCQVASSAMFRRMAKLGMGVNLFVNHVYYWGDIHRTRTVGADKARRMDATATALREGVPMSIHSDHPVTPVNPLFTMWVAVNRRTRSGHVLGEHERITPLQALTAMTLGGAYLMKRDHDLGSIEVGKWADFTVLAENPLDVDPMHIKDIRVVDTVLAGVPTS